MADSFIEAMNNQQVLQYSVTMQVLITIDAKNKLYTAIYLNDKRYRLLERFSKFMSSFELASTMTGVCLSDSEIVDKIDNFLKSHTKYTRQTAIDAMELFDIFLIQLHKDGIYDPKSKIPHDFPENAYLKSF